MNLPTARPHRLRRQAAMDSRHRRFSRRRVASHHGYVSRHRLVSRRGGRALLLETLEDRCLLAGDVSSLPLNQVQFVVSPEEYDDSSILVRYRSDADGKQGDGKQGVASTLTSIREIRLSDGVGVGEALAAYRASDDVLYAEPNYTVRVESIPNDPDYSLLWGLNNTGQTGGTPGADIDAPGAWDFSTGSGGMIVAVVDSGVDYLHEDLADNMWTNSGEIPGDGIDNDDNGYIDDIYGYDFVNDDSDPMDDLNHGTHVAGTIGAVGNNGVGVVGVNWNVQIMAVKFIAANGRGSIADAVDAIRYAVDNGAKLSNHSWGFAGGFSQALYDALADARDAGHIAVAAAGNGDFAGVGQNNDLRPFYPSGFDLDNIVSVAAIDHDDQRATFSNFGAATVDLGAPGVAIRSTTTIGAPYSTFNGTSMAAPHVSGAIALLQDHYPQLTYRQTIGKLFESVDPNPDLATITTTGGRLNAAATMTPDQSGPSITAVRRLGTNWSPLSRVLVTFSEPILAASFTPADVTMTGPAGSVAAADVQVVDGSLDQKFEIFFPTQTQLGDYSITLGPDIEDAWGNLMDQDGDQIAGESSDDSFSATLAFGAVDGRFDFGTSASPLAAGYLPVLASSQYTPLEGFGWEAGTVLAIDRAMGSDLTRDLNYARDMTFAVDLPAARYDLVLTVGDEGPHPHDQVGVYAEGERLGEFSTAAGEIREVHYRGVAVGDGRLSLRMTSEGGADIHAVIQGLRLEPDSTGAAVASVQQHSGPLGPLDQFRIVFNESINQSSFTSSDVRLATPSISVSPISVDRVSATEFDVLFPSQSAAGVYGLRVGPDVLDEMGNPMDQDGDGINGEAVDDVFAADFDVAESILFDFGPVGAPLAERAVPVSPGTAYDGDVGYGWSSGAVSAVERPIGDNLTRDLAYAGSMTFAVDLPPGFYDVEVTIGDAGPYVHDQVRIDIEGLARDTVSTAAEEVATLRYSGVSVNDGQLTLGLSSQGGVDPNATLIALLVRPDSRGPRVESIGPTGTALAPLDHFTLRFDEPIDAAGFTTSDVQVTGPRGDVPVSEVRSLSSTEFEVRFAASSEAGVYGIDIGPGISDLSGNQLDQDGDGVGGELTDDVASASVVLVAQLRFDFGTAASPVEDGFVQVLPVLGYDASNGYGWLSGTVTGLDRGTSGAASRDLHYARDMTFAVDLPNGSYDVRVTAGDAGPYAHDQVGVFLEGNQVGQLSTEGGEVRQTTYAGVRVLDGQLTLRMASLGGRDPNAVIEALEIAPDRLGPSVVAVTPQGLILGPLERMEVTFGEPIDESTFSGGDVRLVGPQGAVFATSVQSLGDDRYALEFPPRSAPGGYELQVGPGILDLAGNAMDQDGDGVPAEPGDDVFRVNLELLDYPRFDFGTASSPVADGFIRVTEAQDYSAPDRYGWLAGQVIALDRAGGSDLTRDLHYSRDMTFGVDVAAGYYDVRLTVGDSGPYAHDQVGILIEDAQFDTVDTLANEVVTRTYRSVRVDDGQFTLRMLSQGGSDPNAVVQGLEVMPDRSGPRVVAITPNDTALSPRDQVKVRFDEPIESSSFTTSDVRIEGPLGIISPQAVDRLSDTEFAIRFDPQQNPGAYRVAIGPDIQDRAGNAMDQDGDRITGEASEDRFESSFTLTDSIRFDFGTSDSPIEEEHIRISPSDVYTISTGFGWAGGAINAVDRGLGTALTRDLVYSRDMTFAVNVPSATYDLTLLVGDEGPHAHDSIGVFVRNIQLDAIDSAAEEVLMKTYSGVAVSDGLLVLRLVSLGGRDPFAVLEGLTIQVSNGPTTT